MTSGSILLYVQRRFPSFKTFGPPLEAHFEGNSCKELRIFLSQQFHVALEHLYAAKFNKFNRTWQVLQDEEDLPKQETVDQPKNTSQESQKDKEDPQKTKKQNNIRSKPYSLKDGGTFLLSVICCFFF